MTVQTMASKALVAFELVIFSWLLVAYGQDIIRGGGREILTIRRAEARQAPEVELCDRALSFVTTKPYLSTLDATATISTTDNAQEEAVSSSSAFEISLHRHGEAEICGSAPLSVESLDAALQSFSKESRGCPRNQGKLDKYQLESLLTEFFHQQFVDGQCASTDRIRNKEVDGWLGFCDMGRDRTVPQPDSASLVEVPSGSLPCRFFTREGLRISTLEQLADLVAQAKAGESQPSCHPEKDSDTEPGTCSPATDGSKHSLEIYAVPAGRVFMFAPKYVGEIFELPHVLDKSGHQLSLTVLSLNPRVFDIHNFFSVSEAQQLIDKALRETSETHKLHRSTTGTIGASVYDRRTSENAWDTHGKLAQTIKRRCMSALGFDEYYESHTDGLQILRYNLTTAYIPHDDYLSDVPNDKYDYRSGGRGGNRFATILLYMSDVEDGGETVFTKGTRSEPVGSAGEVLAEMRKSGQIDMLKPGSWEEEMTGECRTRLAMTPKKSRAVLFYSQFPNGTYDSAAKHGGCPVLKGDKWAANLWAWNAARADFNHAPLRFGGATETNDDSQDSTLTSITALFFNSGKDPKFSNARLYYQDQFFGELGAGESIKVNTYKSHVWNIKNPAGKLLHTWTITKVSSEEQHFTI